MRMGITLPSMGHLAQPDNLIETAKAAERLGYSTLWVADRLLYPVNPRTWMPVGIPVEGMAAMSTQLRQMAKDAGRDPQSLEVIIGAVISITPEPLGADRPTFAGSEDQVRHDIEAVKQLGANEIFFIAFPDGGIKDLVAAMERCRSLI